jgi:tetratricopeptide (TPR) repeat protein
LGDRWGIARSLGALGLVAIYQGHFEQAERWGRESVAFRRELGDQVNLAQGLYEYGVVISTLGRFAESAELAKEGMAICDHLGFREGLTDLGLLLAMAHTNLAHYRCGRVQAQASLVLAKRLYDRARIGRARAVVAYNAYGEGAIEESQQLLRESIALLRQINQRDELGWALAASGYVERRLGHHRQARRNVCEALWIAADIGAYFPAMIALPALALFLADQGEAERAIEVYALISRYPTVAGSLHFEILAGRPLAAASEALPPDVVAAAQERGRARDLEATVVELWLELKISLFLPGPLAQLARPLARILRPLIGAFLSRKLGEKTRG